MGGATIPSPGQGIGAMAFPSTSEPNPLLKGLRGTGPEQIINPMSLPTNPAVPGTSPTTPSPASSPDYSNTILYMSNVPGSQNPLLMHSPNMALNTWMPAPGDPFGTLGGFANAPLNQQVAVPGGYNIEAIGQPANFNPTGIGFSTNPTFTQQTGGNNFNYNYPIYSSPNSMPTGYTGNAGWTYNPPSSVPVTGLPFQTPQLPQSARFM